MCELLELGTAVTNTIFTSIAYVNFKALLYVIYATVGTFAGNSEDQNGTESS